MILFQRSAPRAASHARQASIRKSIALLIGFVLCSALPVNAQGFGSISGTVRDDTGSLLAGAEVVVEAKRLITSTQGGFRFDSVSAGPHLLTIRMVGYSVLRRIVTVGNQVSHSEYVLQRASYVLPTVYTEARRTGIYGTVGDTSFTPLPGVKVQLAGKKGGVAVTDSTGRFAFPLAANGQYVIRVVHPGYAQQHLFVKLGKQDGVEVAIRLRPSPEFVSRADDVAIQDLSRRLVMNLSQDRLDATQLERYGSLGLCEVSSIAARVRHPADSLTIIVNGSLVLEKRSVRDLCSWQAAEVELVEFGDDTCRDVTRSLPDMLNVWCTRFTRDPYERSRGGMIVREGGGEGRIKTQRPSGPFVVIWERQ